MATVDRAGDFRIGEGMRLDKDQHPALFDLLGLLETTWKVFPSIAWDEAQGMDPS